MAGRGGRAPALALAALVPVVLAGSVAAAAPDRPMDVSAHAAPAAVLPLPAPLPAATVDALRIPAAALTAYQRAAQTMAAASPDCGISWQLLAAIGRVESSRANGAATDAPGAADRPIKFLRGTLTRFASAGNGKTNSKNLSDAALATARYLCSGGQNLHNEAQVLTAIRRYNT
ncbi:MAG: lytic transglycosylase, partial [Mycobacterium sp.]